MGNSISGMPLILWTVWEDL